IIDPGVPIDLRMFTRSPSTGTRIVVTRTSHVADGQALEFDAGARVDSAAHLFVFAPLLQPVTSYQYDQNTGKIKFAAIPDAGLPIEICAFSYEQDTGYSTRIVTRTYRTKGATLFLELPVTPQSKEQVFISESGAHVHQENYSIYENYVIFSESLADDIEVEAFIVENVRAEGSENTNLKGVVVDGFVDYKNIVLTRHGAEPIKLPIPAPSLIAGRGISISVAWPELTIARDIDNTGATGFKKYSQSKTDTKTSNMVITQRIELTQRAIFLVTADISSRMGPAFITEDGSENMEFVIGIRSTQSKEPDFGRRIRGTGEAGFSAIGGSNSDVAYSNASMTQVYELDPDNHSSKYVDIVAKMRINNANTSQFDTNVTINLSILEIPL